MGGGFGVLVVAERRKESLGTLVECVKSEGTSTDISYSFRLCAEGLGQRWEEGGAGRPGPFLKSIMPAGPKGREKDTKDLAF